MRRIQTIVNHGQITLSKEDNLVKAVFEPNIITKNNGKPQTILIKRETIPDLIEAVNEYLKADPLTITKFPLSFYDPYEFEDYL